MEKHKIKSIIEAILFAAGRPVERKELIINLEISVEELEKTIKEMQKEWQEQERGIEIIEIENSYQICTKKELYEYIYPVLDKRNKPKLSNAALETLAIISYNPRITKAEIEAIRGVSADGCVYKLLEYGLIEEAGKVIDLPGKPMSYITTQDFLKMFGYKTLNDLPELPKYRLDENRQIVIDELVVQEEKEQKIDNENYQEVQQETEKQGEEETQIMDNKIEQEEIEKKKQNNRKKE